MAKFTVDDLLRFEMIRDVRVRPDGSAVAYELQSIDAASDRYVSAIWLARSDGSDAREMVHATGVNNTPRWSPDGRELAFLSDRNGAFAVFALPADGGEARLVGQLPSAIGSIAWAPDGKTIYATCTLELDDPPDGDRTSTRWVNRPRRVFRQRYKSDGAGFLLQATSRIYAIDVATGDAKALTGGDRDVMTPMPSPDGTKIAFIQNRDGVRDSHLTDVWVMDADGKNARRVTHDVPTAASPAWSPDSTKLAFIGNRVIGEALMFLWMVDVASGQVTSLGGDAVEIASYPLVPPASPWWAPDGERVLYHSARRGCTEVAAVRVATGTVERVVESTAQIVNFHAAGDTIAYVEVSANEPGDVHVRRMSSGKPRRLSQTNTWWRERDAIVIEKITLADAEGWLIHSADRPKGPAPLLLDKHGGPQSFAELHYPYHPYWFALCSLGWNILALNQIGSSSYGVEYARALRSKWGELDLPQELKALDELQQRGICDDRIAVAGKSYGGFMAAYAIGHSDRFKAAVVSAPVASFDSHHGTSDSGYYVDPYDLEGELYEKRELARRLSPSHAIHRATTPTLLLQGEEDQRCPRGQSEELFAIMMRANKTEVEMILYPGGHHDLAEAGTPSHRVDYHRRVVEWLTKHVA